MKVNIRKLQEGGSVLPNVTVTANKLRFVSPEEKDRFDLIKKTQGDKTALNWLRVKQGTTAGINAFAEDPRTQAVMMLVPMPGGFEGFNGIKSASKVSSNLKNPSGILKEISSNSTTTPPFDLHSAIRGAKEFYDNDVQWRFAANRTYPNVNWNSLSDIEKESLNRNVASVKQFYPRPEPVVKFEKDPTKEMYGYYDPRNNEITVTDIVENPIATIIHEHTHQQQHLLGRINPDRTYGYTPEEERILNEAYQADSPIKLYEKGATNRELRYLLSNGHRGPDLDKYINNLGRWDIASSLNAKEYSANVLEHILNLPSDAPKNTAIEKIRTALKFVPATVGATQVNNVQSKQAGGTINNNFNTPIPVNMLDKYKSWYSQLPKNLQETKDYDLQGAFLDNQITHNSHLTDKFKKPNHPTFSNESIYSKYASSGKWGNNTFTIPYRNINRLEEIRKYLKGSDSTTYPVFNGGVVLPEVTIHGK